MLIIVLLIALGIAWKAAGWLGVGIVAVIAFGAAIKLKLDRREADAMEDTIELINNAGREHLPPEYFRPVERNLIQRNKGKDRTR